MKRLSQTDQNSNKIVNVAAGTSANDAVNISQLDTKKTDSMTTNRLLGRGTALTGVIEEITLGTNLSLTGTTLNAAGGTGTVTSASVVSANGFAGTVATATTTPAITVSTSVTGVLKGNGTAISAATSGTDYSAGTSALATGIVKSTTTTGALTIAAAADFPTLNQSTTGTASNVTGTVAIGNGGTGATTTQAAINATNPHSILGDISYRDTTNVMRLAGNTTSAKQFLTQTGTGAVSAAPAWGAIVAGDIPTLNQNTTGTAATITGTLAVSQGGTGATATTGSGSNVLATSPTLVTPVLGTPTSVTLTNATGLPLTTGVTGTLPIANGGTGNAAGMATGLLSATTNVNTGSATAPTTGQVLTATSGTAATWQTPAAGGGSGITRSIISISAPTTAGATAATDYAYFVSGTTTLTLPTAVFNTNRYTVKNTGVNTITVACNGAQTIDGSTTITLPVSNTAVDLISDSSNWQVI